MVETGITDEIILEQNDDTDITDELGVIISSSHTLTQPASATQSVGQGTKGVELVEGVSTVEGSITSQPPNLEITKVFGTFTDNGDGTYSVTFDDQLPTHTLKHEVVDAGGTVTVSGLKFGTMTLEFTRNDPLQLEITGNATHFQNDISETITTPDPNANSRQFFDCKLRIDGEIVGSVDSARIELDRGLSNFKGAEDDAEGEKRLPTQIIETTFDLTSNIVVNITNNRAYEEAVGTAHDPYTVQDDRNPVDATLVIDTDAGQDEMQLLTTLFTEVSAQKQNDGEKRTATLQGRSLNCKVEGDL